MRQLLTLLLLLQALQMPAQCRWLLLAAAPCLPVRRPGPQLQQLWQRLLARWLLPAGSHLLRRGRLLLHRCHCPQWPVDTGRQVRGADVCRRGVQIGKQTWLAGKHTNKAT